MKNFIRRLISYIKRKISALLSRIHNIFIGLPLEFFGFRRRILIIPGPNWGSIRWERVFRQNILFRLCYKLQIVSLTELLAPGEGGNASGIVEKVNGDNYQDISYEGLNLWILAKATILTSLSKGALGKLDSRELKYVRYYYLQTILAIDNSKIIFKRYHPWAIIVSQGGPHFIRAAVEVAHKMNINTVATENTLSKEHFHCDNLTGMIINRHTSAKIGKELIEPISLSDKEKAELQSCISGIRNAKSDEHRTEGAETEEDIRRQLALDPAKKLAVLIGQVHTDASITLDSPIFPDSADFYKRVAAFFAEKDDWILVVRLHPKEVAGVTWAGGKLVGGLPEGESCPPGGIPFNNLTYRLIEKELSKIPNVRIVPDTKVDTAGLLDIADLGITINSQAGFEYLLRQKRLVVGGNAFYGNKGFTYDVPVAEMLDSTLNHAIANLSLNEDEKDLINRFAYIFFTRQLFRKDLKGEWGRLLQVFDRQWGSDIRSILLRKTSEDLDRRKVSVVAKQ
jgi:hypothetical protein